ncbi:glycoside hydrolase family 113 [Agaribacter flavus]|uniref:Glycoside hydrolase n=1 Tax=Agaribacter flavus TaxID=1902781 RepID=A0ABV7FMZ2_9ALTE
MRRCLFTLLAFVVLFALPALASEPKINGISFVASRDKTEQEHIAPLVNTYANYAAVMPYGYVPSNESPTVIFNSDRQWYGERIVGVKDVIKQLKSNKIKTMLKPHLWLRGGVYTRHLGFQSEQQWQAFEQAYSHFIMTYAKVAEDEKVDIFCIGTELETFVKQRPKYWRALISKIKHVYSGKLTYAANWDEYTHVPFWTQLDYIGVDGYFPLSDAHTPSIDNIVQAWEKWKPELADTAQGFKRPILFTEWGFRSVDHTAKAPWDHSKKLSAPNLAGQASAIEGTLISLWSEPWFAGGFIWKWFTYHDKAGGELDNRFTPQNKPSERVLRAFFAPQ